MKVTTTLLFLFLSGAMLGQIPDYFSTRPAWRLYATDFYGGGSCICSIAIDYYYYVDTDTTIAGIDYYTVRKREAKFESSVGPGCTSSCQPPAYVFDDIISFIRQDGRQVYHYNQQSNIDELLIDYSVSVGDSLYMPSLMANMYIHGMDSTMIGGQWRRRFYLGDPAQDTSWAIEGVGQFYRPTLTSEFLGHYILSVEQSPQLWCYSEMGTTLWTNEEYMNVNCDALLDVGVDDISEIELDIFPNPSKETITIRSGLEMDRLKLQNIQGQLVIDRKQDRRKESELHVGQLPPGVYLLSVYFADGQRTVRKLVRE